MNTAELARVALGLKDVRRAGWVRVGHAQAESVADHSWSVALLALLHCPPELDREKVLIMAILHDLAEVQIGDLTPYDGVPPAEKHAREDAAMVDLLEEHPELLAIWRASEARESPESRFVKQMDLLDLRLQAERYYASRAISEEAALEFGIIPK